MKTIYLHIGPRKTGTTTIQKSLLYNQDLLMQNGVLVPKIGRGFPEIAAHHNLAWELLEYSIYSKNFGTWGDLIENLQNSLEQKIILSSEVFSSLSLDQISRVKEYLNKFEVKIIVYLRRQDQLMQSMWAQELKTGDRDQVEGLFSNWLKNNQSLIDQHGLDYYKLLANWSSVFGQENMLIRVLEKDQLNGTLFNDFLSTCEVDSPEKFKISQNQNISPGIKTLVLIRELRERLTGKLDSENRIRFYSYLNIFGITHGWNNQKFNLVDSQTYKRIMRRFRKSNQQIAREYLDRKELFLEPFQEKEITKFSVDEFTQKEILDAFAFVLEKISQEKNNLERMEIPQNYKFLKEQLDAIYSSRGWRILEKFRAVRNKIKELF